MRENRFAGNIPLIPTEYERMLIEDYRHDEVFSEKEKRSNW